MYCGAVEFVCAPAAVRHVPVLLEECLSFLSPHAGGSFADLTFGGGGQPVGRKSKVLPETQTPHFSMCTNQIFNHKSLILRLISFN